MCREVKAPSNPFPTMTTSASKGNMAGLITQKLSGATKFCPHSATAAEDKVASGETKESSLVGEQQQQQLRVHTATGQRRRRKAREAQLLRAVAQQPTYRLEPAKKFDSIAVTQVIRQVLSDFLDGKDYDGAAAATVPQAVCDEVRRRVKQLSFDRYKLVVVAAFGQQQRQGVHVVSRCSWDTSLDNYATATHATARAYCTATVYGVYHD